MLLRYLSHLSQWAHSFTRLFTLLRAALWEKYDLLKLLACYGTAGGDFRNLARPEQASFPRLLMTQPMGQHTRFQPRTMANETPPERTEIPEHDLTKMNCFPEKSWVASRFFRYGMAVKYLNKKAARSVSSEQERSRGVVWSNKEDRRPNQLHEKLFHTLYIQEQFMPFLATGR